MNANLALLGGLSFAFVVFFTLRSYYAGVNPRAAIIEAWVNILIGFTLNFIANFLILPLLGATFTAAENFAIGWMYTAVSVVRQYAIRRWFQDGIHAFALRMVSRGSSAAR